MPPAWLQKPTAQALLLCALTAATYLGVVRAGFVWDDQPLVVMNEQLAHLTNLPLFFTGDLWAGTPTDIGAGSGYYRPLMLASLALDRALFGLDPAWYHLHSLLWHLLAVFTLHRLLLGLVAPTSALAGAALFALHPLQSEAVVWVAGRNDPLAAALLLGALAVLSPPAPGARRLVLGAVLAVGAVLSKESALLAPLVLLVLDLARFQRPRGWMRHAVLWGAVSVHLVCRLLAGVTGSARPPLVGWRLLWHRLPDVAATYGGLLAWPWPLSGGRDLEVLQLSWLPLGAGLVALVCVVVGLLLPARRRSLVAAGLFWALLAFGPAVLALADKGLLGERYLYLPMAGLALALAAALPASRRVIPVMALWSLPWLVIIHLRLPDWKDDVALWGATLRDTPNAYVHAGFGHALLAAGRPLEAQAQFLAALEGQPPQLDVCGNAIGAALAASSPALAVTGAARAAAAGCDSDEFKGFRAVALAMAGEWPSAVALAREADGDPRRRAALVLAAWDVVGGRCEGYRSLSSDSAERAQAREQMVKLLHHGGYAGFAEAWLASGACEP